jgi:hypothetical protein
MNEEVSVKVTVTVQPQDTQGQGQQLGQDNPLSTNLDLQKIYEQIIERETDADKEEEAKPLLLFLIAVEAVEKLNDVNAGGKVVFSLPKAVAGLLGGKLDLELTESTNRTTPKSVKVEVNVS